MAANLTHLFQSHGKRHLSTSGNDDLRFEFAALKKVPALFRLPFEILEKILDEVRSGALMLACALDDSISSVKRSR